MVRNSFIDQVVATFGSLGHEGLGRTRPETRLPPTEADKALALAPPPAFDWNDNRIPKIARPIVDAIVATIAAIEQRALKDGTASAIMEDIRQMKVRHLPDVLRSYIDMPQIAREAIFQRTGRSASYSLCDGVAKMKARVDELAQMQANGDIDEFTKNMIFIGQRYGSDPFAPLDL